MKILPKIQDYLLLTVGIFLICLAIFKPWQRPLTLPRAYWSDAYFQQMLIKNQLTSGKFWYSNQLSLPGEQNLLDFPIAEIGLQGIVLVFSLLTNNHFLIFNLLFISSFFLNGLMSFFVLRQMKFKKIYSYWGALIFAFLPYHFARGAIHLSLSHYFIIPLVFLLASWILFNHKGKFRNWQVLLTGVLAGSTGIYYAYFSSLLILFSLFVAALQKRLNKHGLLFGLLFIMTVSSTILVQLLPNFKFWAAHGKNIAIAHRVPSEAVLHGLKLRQLFIPLYDYNLSFLKSFTHKYKNDPGWGIENKQYLGLIGIGGVIICAFIFFNMEIFDKKLKKEERQKSFLKIKAWYFIFMLLVLVSMSYGGASIIANLVSPKIRAYGRMVPFLNFVLIIIVLLVIQSWQIKFKKKKFFLGLVGLIFAFALFDSLKTYQPIRPKLITDFHSDQKFVTQIEEKLDKGSAVYQLPYKDFPETPDLYKLRDYELLKGFLHSKDLKWSYGSLKGRHIALWQWDLFTKPPSKQLKLMRKRNFSGLYIDTYGYQDEGVAVVASFSALLKQTPLISENRRLVFFDLRKAIQN